MVGRLGPPTDRRRGGAYVSVRVAAAACSGGSDVSSATNGLGELATDDRGVRRGPRDRDVEQPSLLLGVVGQSVRDTDRRRRGAPRRAATPDP